MSNVIEWPKFNIRKKEEDKSVKFVACRECDNVFFLFVVDEAIDQTKVECGLCGTELESGPEEEA